MGLSTARSARRTAGQAIPSRRLVRTHGTRLTNSTATSALTTGCSTRPTRLNVGCQRARLLPWQLVHERWRAGCLSGV